MYGLGLDNAKCYVGDNPKYKKKAEMSMDLGEEKKQQCATGCDDEISASKTSPPLTQSFEKRLEFWGCVREALPKR